MESTIWQEEKTIMKEIVIGATLIFKENAGQSVSGILKSVVLKTKKNEIDSAIISLSEKISKFYDYSFIGLYDIFLVSGELKEGEVLGRTTYYEYDNLKLGKSLVANKLSIKNKSKSNTVNCSLIFFCDSPEHKFAISVITIIDTNNESILDKANDIAISTAFIKKIKNNSIEKIANLSYLGINDFGEVDLKFNTFQTFYADFENLDALKGEVMSKREKTSKIKDILVAYNDIVY